MSDNNDDRWKPKPISELSNNGGGDKEEGRILHVVFQRDGNSKRGGGHDGGGTEMDTPTQSLEPGYWVALTLKPGAAPLRCYVGEVQATDERGVRITLIDWLTGRANSYDLFVSWENITSSLVCTPEHDLENFGRAAERWQNLSTALDKPAEDKQIEPTD